eukprot:362329-Chlamydomonas_euryale.AAC.1
MQEKCGTVQARCGSRARKCKKSVAAVQERCDNSAGEVWQPCKKGVTTVRWSRAGAVHADGAQAAGG